MEAGEVIQGHIAGQLSEPRLERQRDGCFMCQRDWATEDSGILPGGVLIVSLRVFSDEFNI